MQLEAIEQGNLTAGTSDKSISCVRTSNVIFDDVTIGSGNLSAAPSTPLAPNSPIQQVDSFDIDHQNDTPQSPTGMTRKVSIFPMHLQKRTWGALFILNKYWLLSSVLVILISPLTLI